jgi:hypothetical protein
MQHKIGMTASRIADTAALSPALNHALDCDTCLSVLVSLHLPVSACEQVCPEYRALLFGAVGQPTIH